MPSIIQFTNLLYSSDTMVIFQKETMKALALLIIYTLCSYALSAQTQRAEELYFNHLGVKDGLPEGTVIQNLHDSHGYVWICTQNGLVRFDGYQLKKYNFELNDINSRSVRIIYEDKATNIWIGTGSGLYKYDRSLDTVSKFYVQSNDNLKNCLFTFIKENARGEMWLMYNNTAQQTSCLALLNPATKKITVYGNQETGYRRLNTKKLFGVCELDDKGSLWIGSDRGILQYLPDRHRFKEHIFPNDAAHLNYAMDIRHDTYVKNWLWFRLSAKSTNQSVALGRLDIHHNKLKFFNHSDKNSGSIHCDTAMYALRDSHNQAWFVTFKGLARFDSATESFTNFDLNEKNPLSSQLWRAKEDLNGNLWCKGDGLVKFNIKTGKFTRYTMNDKEIEGGILALPVVNIAIDNFGAPWFGIGQSGLQWLDKGRSKFTYYKDKDGTSHFFPGGRINCFKESSDGNIWIGSQKGLYLWHRQQDYFEPIHLNKLPNTEIFIPALTLDRLGNVWFSAYNQASAIAGLYCYNPSTQQLKNYRHSAKDSLSLSHNSIRALTADIDGNVWIGTQGGGLCKINSVTERFTRYPYIINNNTTLPDHNALDDDQVISLYVDKFKVLWIGTNNGSLNKYNVTTGKFSSFIHKVPECVISITEDKNDNIWAGTYYAGLISLNRKTNAIHTYLEKDGLGYDGCLGVATDEKNNVYITSPRGLSILDIQTSTIRSFTTLKGLPTEPSGLGLLRTNSGQLLFGVKGGFITLNPADFKPEPTVPKINIESVQFANLNSPAPFRDSVINKYGRSKVSLSYNQNRITFNYVGIHHPSRTNIRYSYKLAGYDPTWVQAGSQRTVTYTNLSPGTYTFYVKAANSDGVWSKESDSIIILIAAPWWRTWWAYLFYFLASGTIIYALYRNWLSRAKNKQHIILQQKEAVQLKALDEMKSRFFSNITHEFRTPLSLIIAPLEQMQKSSIGPEVKSRLQPLQRNAEQLLHLVNQLLDMSKLEAKSMRTHLMRGDLLLFVKQIVEDFSFQAQAAELTLVCDIPDHLLEHCFDAENLRKIVQNLLSNAIKFTPPGGLVTVMANVSAGEDSTDLLQIDVTDTGIGIPDTHLDGVFNRFFQVDNSRTRFYSGTGIGLSLVKELTDLMGGKVIARNNSAGHGTTLSLSLPVSNLQNPDIPRLEQVPVETHVDLNGNFQSQSDAPLTDNDKPVILIAEDHSALRTFLADLFVEHFRVLTSGNGKEGWEIAQQEIPDIIISDMMMPGMDGIEFCQLVKTSVATSHIGFVMLTAKTAQSSILEGLQNKADAYILKPFHIEELLLRVSNLIDHQKKLRSFYNKQLSVADEPLQSPVAIDPFLENVYSQIDNNIEDADFTIDQLATAVNVSARTLVRKLNAIAGLSPTDLLKQYRLKKAALLLNEGIPVSEVAWRVGFGSRNYFSTAFKAFFDVAPSEYVKTGVSK